MDKLEEYNRKRDFEKTGEPRGAAQEEGQRLRFVVQHHAARRDHFDFRLEWDGALLSWAVPKGPSYNPRDKRLAVMVEDHPVDYRNFEGVIPKGEYGGGVVMIWDEGFWAPKGNVDEGLRSGSLKFSLEGRRLKGGWALVRMKAKEGKDENNWLLLKEKDEYAKDSDGISEFTTSIRTGRTMEQIEKGENVSFPRNPFDKAEVQLAKLVAAPPEGDGWLYEVKYDGYRILAFIEGNTARLLTRGGNDYADRFAAVANSLLDFAAGRAMVLDGEMAVIDESGRTDFQALQSYMRTTSGKNLTYIVFDILALDGKDLRQLPLEERKGILENLMKNAPQNVHLGGYVRGGGKECFEAACKAGLEGIVGKRAGSVYSGTRNGDWIKLKCDRRQEFVIGGYTLSEKKASGVSSLLLGVYDGGDLVFAGRAGTGFSARAASELEEKFSGLRRETSPFKNPPKEKAGERIFWLEPELVAEIKFTEWTKENLLRQASFKGLRTDKNPKDVRLERKEEELSEEKVDEAMETSGEVVIEGVKVTHPDKVLFEEPRTTKIDVVRYYEKVAKRMLPYVSRRILSIVRCPKGIGEACFFKKHPGPGGAGIVTIPVTNSDGETEEYFYIDNISGLVYEAQMGTLEFHTWASSVDSLEQPDMMVFDLDPDEGMDIERVRQGVRDVKSILDALSLASYLKTSGGKGYHVVVPFKPSADWDTFRDFAKHVAEVMEQKWPDRYTSNVRKDKRKNKIFVDWIRNARSATSVAPYSLRARKGAKVSMPIAWDELETVAPDGVDMNEALRRIEKDDDPWKGFFETDQRLK